MTLMVSFGAGASYDSSPHYPAGLPGPAHRPPLANELFTDRPEFEQALTTYSELHEIVPRLLPLTGDWSLESVLERLKD